MTSESENTQNLYVLGAGVCGLYGALEAQKSGFSTHVLEKGDRLGGLAAGHHKGGNWYDLGVHMLHAFDQEIFETCSEAMEEERMEVPLKAHIKWQGKIYHYPLRGRDIIKGIPPFKLCSCLMGLFTAELKKSFKISKPCTDAEAELKNLYGTALYRFFFEEFTHRYWGIHPRELSAEFIRQKMPRLSAVDVFKNVLSWLKVSHPQDTVEGALRFETLHYSKSGSETLPRSLGKRLKELGGEVMTNSSIDCIVHDEKRITGLKVDQKSFGDRGDDYLSTIPINEFTLKLSPPAPQKIKTAAQALNFKPMVVYALLIKKERCMEALYTYYRDQIFHRIGEPKNANLEVTPKGHTTLIVEMTCEVGDDKWEGKALDKVFKGLEAEGLCDREDLVEKHIIRSRHAYPIFQKGYENHLKLVTDYLDQFSNLKSTGRQGAFCYPNMHQAMKMGSVAASDFVRNQPELD